jgi:hypothetical protein
MNIKRCPCCEINKPIDEFDQFRSGPKQGRYRIYCKRCELNKRHDARHQRRQTIEQKKLIEDTIGPKTCKACKVSKSLNEFHFHQGKYRHGLPFPNCKECHNKKILNYHTSNKKIVNEIIQKSRLKTHKLKRALILLIKSRPCHDCGKSFHPYAMEFDHKDPSIKYFGIGTHGKLYSVEMLMNEIKKCDVVCSVCHKIRTANTLNFDKMEEYIQNNMVELTNILYTFGA